jgi:enamine deaminase RidA (YjgF/YER057c/UK114 family)
VITAVASSFEQMQNDERLNVSSGTPWESIAGYSRAVRIGQLVFVSGTTPADTDGRVQGVGNAYAQTKYVLEKIENALKQTGASISDVVRTRMFVIDISLSSEISKAHNEFFHDVRPAATMVQVSALQSKGMLVEIEADAVIRTLSD